MVAVVRGVVDGEDELVVRSLQHARDVEGEGIVAPKVPTDARAIEVDSRIPVNCSKVEERPSRGKRRIEDETVPQKF